VLSRQWDPAAPFDAAGDAPPVVEVVYPKTKKLEHDVMAGPAGVAAALLAALRGSGGGGGPAGAAAAWADPLPPAVVARYGLMGWADALAALHAPGSSEEHQRARERVAFQVGAGAELAWRWGFVVGRTAPPPSPLQRVSVPGCSLLTALPCKPLPPPTWQEMFLGQLAAMLERRRLTSGPAAPAAARPSPGAAASAADAGVPHPAPPPGRVAISITRLDAVAAARGALPYRLTGSQDRVLSDVLSDLAGPGVMMRLLQGDVGCGKTVVALLAMLAASGSGAARGGGRGGSGRAGGGGGGGGRGGGGGGGRWHAQPCRRRRARRAPRPLVPAPAAP
jgi:hypothetical protein